jgi:membrane protein DedA with SNARE-associated domain
MPFPSYLWYNLLGTLPKSLALVAIGYTFGYAYNQIDSYIFQGSLIVGVGVVLAFLFWLWWRSR